MPVPVLGLLSSLPGDAVAVDVGLGVVGVTGLGGARFKDACICARRTCRSCSATLRLYARTPEEAPPAAAVPTLETGLTSPSEEARWRGLLGAEAGAEAGGVGKVGVVGVGGVTNAALEVRGPADLGARMVGGTNFFFASATPADFGCGGVAIVAAGVLLNVGLKLDLGCGKPALLETGLISELVEVVELALVLICVVVGVDTGTALTFEFRLDPEVDFARLLKLLVLEYCLGAGGGKGGRFFSLFAVETGMWCVAGALYELGE